MSNLYHTDFMILKRIRESADRLGGFDAIKSSEALRLQFKMENQADADTLAGRYGTRTAAELMTAALRDEVAA